MRHLHTVHHSDDHRHPNGGNYLTKVAGIVNRLVGSPLSLVLVSSLIVSWLVLGQVSRFDPLPWPLLLTIVNIPQLSIMVALQVSANLAQQVSDARAAADHITLQHIVDELDALRHERTTP